LDGFNIKGNSILIGTMYGYLHAINLHYKGKGFIQPFNKNSNSDAAQLLCEQEKFGDEPSKRSPLTNQTMDKLWELVQVDSVGFRVAAWDLSNLDTCMTDFMSRNSLWNQEIKFVICFD